MVLAVSSWRTIFGQHVAEVEAGAIPGDITAIILLVNMFGTLAIILEKRKNERQICAQPGDIMPFVLALSGLFRLLREMI